MSRPIRAILAVDDGIDSDNLVALFGGDETLRLAQVVTRFEDASRILDETQADVLVIAALGYSERALSLLDRAVKADAERPVLVLSQDSPNGFVRRVFESGGEDILVMPQSPEQFQFAVQKAIARRRSNTGALGAEKGRIIAVLGPKGGTGKTLTSSNLTIALAQAGMRTVIVDLDLQFGDVGLTMGLAPDRTMYDLALAGGTIDFDKLSAYLTPHPTGAQALLAPNQARPGRRGHRPDAPGHLLGPSLRVRLHRRRHASRVHLRGDRHDRRLQRSRDGRHARLALAEEHEARAARRST